MLVIPDLAKLRQNPLVLPPFKRPSEINTNDLAEYTGVNAFEVIRRRHRKKVGVQEFRSGTNRRSQR